MENPDFTYKSTPRVLPRAEPHAKKKCCSDGFRNCIKFASARRYSQDEMLEEEMAIDTRHLVLTPKPEIHGL